MFVFFPKNNRGKAENECVFCILSSKSIPLSSISTQKNKTRMAKQHTDSQNQLFISPFRIYVHLRVETLHLVPLFTQLNEDPEFTRGIFSIAMLPTDITDNVKIVFNPLFAEFVNLTHDKNFNERDSLLPRNEEP